MMSPLRPPRAKRVPTCCDTEERLAPVFRVPHRPRMIVLVRSCLSSLAPAILRQVERRRTRAPLEDPGLGFGRNPFSHELLPDMAITGQELALSVPWANGCLVQYINASVRDTGCARPRE
jgi:hypothetical protein